VLILFLFVCNFLITAAQRFGFIMAEQTISDNGADESQEEETTKPEQVFGKLRPKE